jgi:hypothetical protein
MKRSPVVARYLEGVWLQLGRNVIIERWIADKHGWLGYQEPGRLVISPLNLVKTIIHEAVHAAHPRMTERGVERVTTRIWASLSDEECRRLWDAYNAKVTRIVKPIPSSEQD